VNGKDASGHAQNIKFGFCQIKFGIYMLKFGNAQIAKVFFVNVYPLVIPGHSEQLLLEDPVVRYKLLVI
jgi:hypothetical protein